MKLCGIGDIVTVAKDYSLAGVVLLKQGQVVKVKSFEAPFTFVVEEAPGYEFPTFSSIIYIPESYINI
jgi:hypothetical protein